MARRIYNLKIFVGSPSDVAYERVLLETVVNELNKLPGERLGIRLEIVKWETDTYPSFGKDAQSVINEQIGDDYDIFIGILWKRFGTATARAESGTAEEFDRAYQRGQENPNNVKVMLYFNESPVSLTELEEVEQYKKVISFRKSIGEQGVYYGSYKKTEDFTSILRMHLGRVMEEFGTKWGEDTDVKVETEVKAELTSVIAPATLFLADTDAEEEGFLDLVITSVENTGLARESLERLSTLLQELNEKTVNNTAEIKQLPQPIDANQAKPIINRQADNWENFAQRAEAELPILATKFRTAINSFTKAGQIMNDFEIIDKETVTTSLDAIVNLKTVAIKAQESTLGFRKAVQSVPRMTTRLNHSKRYLVEVLDKIVEEYQAVENLSTEAEKMFLDLLEKANSGNEDANSS
jgi:hypothetical protein